MRITYNLKLSQTQKVVMTPQLQQAIHLLQLSAVELQTFLQNEILSNPVLELEEEDDSEKRTTETEPFTSLEKDSIDWEEYFKDEGLEPLPQFSTRNFGDLPSVDYYLTNEPTLQEHLIFQLGLCTLTETERRIGEFLIGNIDSNGYLKGEIQELAALIGADRPEILGVLEIIQKFDPVGVGARNLQECLTLQVRERQDVRPLTQKIINHYLPDVAANKIKKIAAELHVDLAAVQMAVDFIRSLDPKPGRSIGGNHDVRYVIPDVVVEKVQDEYVVLVNEYNMPRLTINPYYRSLLHQENDESLTGAFIRNRLDAAVWLLRIIEQRRNTLYRVTECVLKKQLAFFEGGIKCLKPMTMRQIADDVRVHESTVSRVAANKYVQTPRGLFPLKFFFASGVEDEIGTATSSESIKSHLKELIDAENENRPFSDQKLRELLIKRGIVVSRRTVAKYREDMAIPASNKRKRLPQ